MAFFQSLAKFDIGNVNLYWYSYYLEESGLQDNSYVNVNGHVYEDLFYVDGYDGVDWGELVFLGSGITQNLTGAIAGGTVNSIGEIDLFTDSLLWFVEGISTSAVAIYNAALTPSNQDEIALIQSALAGDDTIVLSPFDDRMYGFDGNDDIYGNGGNDTIDAGNGNDNITGGAGNDSISGGAGTDWAWYDDATAGVTVNLSNGTARSIIGDNAAIGIDNLASIENVTGSNSADSITGDIASNLLDGNGGDDWISGGDGADQLFGWDGNDQLFGETGNDHLDGENGNDTLTGGSGSDTLNGGAGNDLINGDAGLDTAIYSGLLRSYGVQVSGSSGTVSGGAEGGTDTLSSVEFLQFQDGVFVFDADGVAAQVTRLYDTVLQRGPDQVGLDLWVDRIEDQGSTLKDVATGFLNSAEFQARTGQLSNTDYVEFLYQNALGRASEAAGKSYWVGQLDSGARDRADLLIGFSESSEHHTLTADLVSQGFFNTDDDYQSIALLYDTFAGRQPDADGLIFWAEAIENGTYTLDQVADGFANSVEFRGLTDGLSNSQLVEFMYQNTLGRHSEPAGLSYWTQQLDAGMDKGDLLLGFSQSTEHFTLLGNSITGGIDVL